MDGVTRALCGGVEAGGTKFVCAVGPGDGHVRAETAFRTTTPGETLGRVIDFFEQQQRHEPLSCIGIGAFGPVDLDPASATYGHITTTPKPGWANTDLVGVIQDALGVRAVVDTDVNAAALGEYMWGAAQGLDTFVYVTVGTGIGGGGMVNGRLMHGLLHPEMGHMRIPHDWDGDPFPGVCPYHGDCLEGLACATALERRWGQPPETLPDDHPAWSLEARYMSLGLVNLICALSPQRIIVGGGVATRAALLPLVRENVLQLLNRYIETPRLVEGIDDYIVKPGLGERSGVLGAIALACVPSPLG